MMKKNEPAIVVDLDGCLVDIKHRIKAGLDNPDTFYEGIENDEPIWALCTLISAVTDKFSIFILTGRPERVREQTETWLQKHFIPYNRLIMRPDGGAGVVADYKLANVQALTE